ncbi:hypothetical protein ACFLU6_00185 [Acidobacteriota bacterium]
MFFSIFAGSQDLKAGQILLTATKAGESNIRLEWVDQTDCRYEVFRSEFKTLDSPQLQARTITNFYQETDYPNISSLLFYWVEDCGFTNLTFERFTTNPLIHPDLDGLQEAHWHHGLEGDNINGPSIIEVPDWIPNRMGKYYMYFAHHNGSYIRLAYAFSLAGPWTVYADGVLHREQTVCRDHIASPDVHIDHVNQRIVMYFHGDYHNDALGFDNQYTFVAASPDGISFTALGDPDSPNLLGEAYFRVWQYGGYYYAVSMDFDIQSAVIYRSTDPLTGPGQVGQWERGPAIMPYCRHAAVRLCGDILWIFFSRIGDAPERILLHSIDLRSDWLSWDVIEPNPIEILRPETEYEGADLPITPSESGLAVSPVHQLRDPAIFIKENRIVLFYSIAGEQGIAGTELVNTD